MRARAIAAQILLQHLHTSRAFSPDARSLAKPPVSSIERPQLAPAEAVRGQIVMPLKVLGTDGGLAAVSAESHYR